ncbi:MAG: IPT/TIG domain-containing protein [Polyangiaceae bacterium]
MRSPTLPSRPHHVSRILLAVFGLATLAAACARPVDSSDPYGARPTTEDSRNGKGTGGSSSQEDDEEEVPSSGQVAKVPSSTGGSGGTSGTAGSNGGGDTTRFEVLALDPASVRAGSADTRIRVVGTGFVSGAKVSFGTTELATTFENSAVLNATIPAAQLMDAKAFDVTVKNPGGTASPALKFTVAASNAAVLLTSIDPAKVVKSTTAIPVTVKGSGFTNASKVLVADAEAPTTFVSATELKVQVPATKVGAAGDVAITVSTGGSPTSAIQLRVDPPKPTFASITPQTLEQSSTSKEVVITGTNFESDAKVAVNQHLATKTVVNSSTKITATISATDLASAGSLSVRVYNDTPFPYGVYAVETKTITVTGTSTSALSVAPSKIPAYCDDTTVVFTGSGFSSSDVVVADGTTLSCTGNGTKLTCTLPSSLLVLAGHDIEVRITGQRDTVSIYTDLPGTCP